MAKDIELTYVQQFIERGILPSLDILSKKPSLSSFDSIPGTVTVMNCDALQLIEKKNTVDWLQFDRLRSHYEHGRQSGYLNYIQYFSNQNNSSKMPLLVHETQKPDFSAVKVSFSYEGGAAKHTVSDFVKHFKHRYVLLERMLRVRPELQNSTSINRILKKQSKESVSLIGMVIDKSETKNGNLMLTVEDPTGRIRILINKSKPNLFNQAKDIVFDEVIGISGACGNKIVFVNNLFWPDIPYNNELRKTSDDVCAVFLSDIHVGSEYFLEEEFKRFLRWICGESGTAEQRETAKKVQYIFIAGDIVDGVGIYPKQDDELVIKDIYKQYSEFANLIAKIPKHIKIIICPGNHDALRLAEPQPILDEEFTKPIYELNNVTVVSNPSIVNIHSNEDFEGINVLLYHGYSFDYFVANVDSIRSEGGYRRSDLIMKFLLKRRHLAPAQGSTLRIPDPNTDPLVIKHIPDIFVTGHIHYSLVAHYRNVTMISGSCWQRTTNFQEKLGHEPEPARVPIINLKTRKVKILKFM